MSTWNVCHEARRMTSKTFWINSSGTSWWKRSLIELTKIICGFFISRGDSRRVLVHGQLETVGIVGLSHCLESHAMRSA